MALKLIKKAKALTKASALEASVAKEGGPVKTALEVGSTGADDRSFSDAQLTPGPASTTLDPSNSYTLVWAGSFTRKGTATLTVRILDAAGVIEKIKTKKVSGVAGDEFARVILIP